MEETLLSPSDYVDILKRRIWSGLLPAVLIFIVALIVAFSLPAVYKSTATILIEEQDIPADYVVTTVTSYAEQRLQTINQRIMSSSRLLDIINRFNLYSDKKEKWTTDEILGKMREDFSLVPISVEVTDRRTGRPAMATIAFTLSYEGKDSPEKIQQVANVITTLFLTENIQVRKRQTTETSIFLEKEMALVKVRLAKIDAEIAEFKKKNINNLPELFQVNMQSLNNFEQSIERLSEQLKVLRERKSSLETRLFAIVSESESQDKIRLDQLRLALVNLKINFSEKYPDVIKVKSEIAELEERIKKSRGSENWEREDNPVYITFASQLSGINAEVNSVKRHIKELEKKKDNYRKRIEATPEAEKQLKSLSSEQININLKYKDLMGKLMEARVAQGLEKEQKGERFTLIDPPMVPEKPFKPNRVAIILIGLVLGMGAGVGAASLHEFSDQSVHKAGSLFSATSFPVLAEIPEIINARDIELKNKKRLVLISGILLSCVVGVILFHFFIMDLNIFWAKLMRKI